MFQVQLKTGETIKARTVKTDELGNVIIEGEFILQLFPEEIKRITRTVKATRWIQPMETEAYKRTFSYKAVILWEMSVKAGEIIVEYKTKEHTNVFYITKNIGVLEVV